MGPRISVILPTYTTQIHLLQGAIESVLGQTYTDWELCIADDRSRNQAVRPLIESYVSQDPRIKAIFRETNGHISAATDSAASLATGAYLAFLDHDDLLSTRALEKMATETQNFPGTALVYSDEDKVSLRGWHYRPHFKSDFNRELLLSYNYPFHLFVVEREISLSRGNLLGTRRRPGLGLYFSPRRNYPR